MDRLKRKLDKLDLPTTGTKNELQRRLREELQPQGIDIDSYEFEDEEEREIRCRHKFVAAMMEKMQILTEI